MTPSAIRGPLADLRHVRVGSMNAPKLTAVREAVAAYASGVSVEGVQVDSGVPEQPVGFEEIIAGARNRAARAAAGADCDLAVGIEDGLVPLPIAADGAAAHLNIGCVAITDGRRTSIGFSSAFAYPPECSLPAVRDREPIGAIFDRLWQDERGDRGAEPSALSIGNVGRLSEGVLQRAEYARHGVLCALIAFLQPDFYAREEVA